ncbi:MAG: TolC family protein [Terracidiphilus sp.]|jgi:cobalt-zinc-cadmium efflux system outer membrane protein
MQILKLMRRQVTGAASAGLLLACCLPMAAQHALTWDEVKAKFEAVNPTLKTDQANVDEMKTEEITAFLRPNPQFTMTADGTTIVPHGGSWQPLRGTFEQPNFSYLHEREHKRELRLESAKEGTAITESQHVELEINLIYGLRSAFVQTLQAKAVLALAKADLEYYDKIIDISRARFGAGDLAKIDLARIELQRVQYESEIEAAIVNLRQQKIALLLLLDDRTPVDQFDVIGAFELGPDLQPLDDYHKIALNNRPDLRAAIQTIQQSETNHKLAISNGSTDPTFGAWYTHNSSDNNPNGLQTLGLSVSIPLRIFDKNQGEKKRTLIDIDRSTQATEAAKAQVFSDVDNAYELVRTNIALIKPYKAQYLDQSVYVRDTVTFAYQHGGASLIDFLNAQSDYRVVQLSYLQLIGAYMTAEGQMNLAVGHEVFNDN